VHVWHDLSEIDPGLGPAVVTIGNFDGVHRGHRHVIARAHDLAAELGGLPVVAVTFHPHPMTVVRPDHAPQMLMTLEERISMLQHGGANGVLVLTFTPELAAMAAEDFVVSIVLDALQARGVVVGENFRFGHRAGGDVDLLTRLCKDRGVTVVGLPLDGADGQVWSSTYIRRCVEEGDVAAAARALSHPFAMHGYVVPGERRGRALGFPTANVPVAQRHTAVPADGVYAGWVRLLEEPNAAYWPAAISVGTNPTFDGVQRQVESYVLDRDDLELYGRNIEVSFVERLRGMERFDSVEELVAQMRDDVDRARAVLVSPPAAG